MDDSVTLLAEFYRSVTVMQDLLDVRLSKLKLAAFSDFNALWDSVRATNIAAPRSPLSSKYQGAPPPAILKAHRLGGLPPCAGIYFVWNKGRIVYVGQSTNLLSRCRLGIHAKIQAGDSISWIEFPKHELFYAEAFYIGMIRPVRNLPANFRLRSLKEAA